MSIEYENLPPDWENKGTEPTDLKTNGFYAGYKPPAAYFNWFFNRVSVCLKELQTKFKNHADKSEPIPATSTDGVTYTATLNGVTQLYDGLEITLIPNKASTATIVKLNLNGLGEKNVRAKINGYNNGNSGTAAAFAGWIGEGAPIRLRYVSKFDNWQTVDFSRPSASGLYGTIDIEQGGTGATTAAEACTNLGACRCKTGVTSASYYVANDIKLDIGFQPKLLSIYYSENINGIMKTGSGLYLFAQNSMKLSQNTDDTDISVLVTTGSSFTVITDSNRFLEGKALYWFALG